MFCRLQSVAVRSLVGAALLTFAMPAAWGLDPATPLSRLTRQAWSMENGLPQNTVPVLLQANTGYLLVGTELGLSRFDGVGFQAIDHTAFNAIPEAETRCLLDVSTPDASKTDGSKTRKQNVLWVGTSDGLVRWVNGHPTVLTTQNGLPGNSIKSLVQTTDGIVWVLTEDGLAHWSGSKFEQAFTASNKDQTPTSVAPGTSGDLWIGTADGTKVLRQGKWFRGPGSGASLVTSIANNEVLISNLDGVFIEAGGHSKSVLPRSALPRDGVSFAGRLRDGTIAIASKSEIVLAGGSSGRPVNTTRFTVSKDLPGTKLPGSRIEVFYVDHSGTLWVGTNHGLARIGVEQQRAVSQQMPATDPLAIDAIASLLEDREGDLWVGTETSGLHVLRAPRFRVIGVADGLSSDDTTAVAASIPDQTITDRPQPDTRGDSTAKGLWIGTRGSGLNYFVPEEEIGSSSERSANRNLTTKDGLLSDVILSLAAAPGAVIWVGTPDGLNRVSSKSHKVDRFTSADGLPDDFIRSLLVEPDDSVWIGTRRGLSHLAHGRFHNLTVADGLGSDLTGALARSPDGDLWIATLNGLSRLHQGHLHNYTTADGLSSNIITALDVTPDGTVWIGTQNEGLNVWNGHRMLRIPAAKPKAAKPRDHSDISSSHLPRVIHGIVHDNRGYLWLASDSGLTQVDSAALLACAQNTDCDSNLLNAANFSTADGLRSRGMSSNSHPTACRMSNGTLWFSTPRGVVSVDPNHLAKTLDPVPAVIEHFSVDDQEFDSESNELIRISAGHLRFQFDYAGLSFAVPQKLRYQYQLAPFDRSWTDAGTRRTAYYTNIPPGKYRFLVRVSVAGSFTALPPNPSSKLPEAELTFELLPHSYQTIWFKVLMACLAAALIVLVFRRRVSGVRRELRAVMAERNRIAREIHDTLAQGYVGISLQLEVLGELLRHHKTEAAANHLVLTQGLVREGLDDARQSIWALRSQDANEDALPIRLQRLVENAHSQALSSRLEVHGAYRSFPAVIEKEILRIAQEGIQNVKRHAAASRMEVRLDYEERSLVLSIVDDGRGFLVAPDFSNETRKVKKQHPATQAPTIRTGNHFGLIGMRERASLIRAKLDIVSEPGQGTTLTLTIPTVDHAIQINNLNSNLDNPPVPVDLTDITSTADNDALKDKPQEHL